ncbi:MAG: hypothetical protein ACE5DK_08810 [Paracoccaceae bacterium]
MELPLPRVVQVGFNKCATRSLANLFAGSGHRSAHQKFRRPFGPNRNIAALIRDNKQAGRPMFDGFDDYVFYADLVLQTRTETYEAFKDFRRILADYPDTILLLNTRDRENWIRSRVRHGHGTFLEMVTEANGFETKDACLEFWRQDWDRHLADVRGFMADRPDQLVEFNTDTGNVHDLCARLPAYALNPVAWGTVGRSRGRRRVWILEKVATLNARRKSRR